MIKSLILMTLALLPCSCTTVVEPPPQPTTNTTVHRETRTIIPVDGATQTTTTTVH
jgi:hypothetical protein